VLLVTRDRPGYAKSSRRHGRRVADDVDDVVLVADHLGLERFGVMGVSGGGPHALACGALLPERVVGVFAGVCPAPLGEGGMPYEAWIEGTDPENVAYSELEIAGDEEGLTARLEEDRLHIAAHIADDPMAGIEAFELSDADRAAFAQPELAQVVQESGLEWTSGEVGGWVDDSFAIVRPWGFDPRAIAVPVVLRIGLTDVFVPPAHGRWLAERIPGCEVWADEAAGHFSPGETDIRRRLEWLLARAGASAS
jgi:pimeloyl-ACP methyl ester carboxylesterase